MSSRTHDEVYKEWKASNPPLSWREHVADEDNRMLERYAALGLRVIPLGEKSKRPIDGWASVVHTKLYLFQHLSRQGNIGVVAGLSRPPLVILDYDEQDAAVRPLLAMTLSSISPNGYHLFTQGQYDEKLFARLKKKLPKLDLARAGHGYVVVPPSMTCKDEHAKHDCEALKRPHRYRVHEWLNIDSKLMDFQEFAEACLR